MSIRYPEIRERIKVAARVLADEELHDRVWVRGQRASATDPSFVEQGFDDTLLVFIDELDMFGPGDLIGNVLTDEREEIALEALQDSIRALTIEIGTHGTISDALAAGDILSKCKNEAAELERLLSRDV